MGAAAAIGLNIGNSTIRAVELRAAGGRYEVVGLGIVPTPEGTVVGGSVADPEAVGLAVKDLLQTMGARTKQCISSVAGQTSLVVRVIDVPRMSPKELDDMMKFELERHIPFQANEVILDFKPIKRPNDDPTSPNMEILLAAAQEEMINAHVATVEKAGLAPRAIDIEPLAAARVLVQLMGGPDETVGLLNIGSGSSEISVIRDGMLAFTRTVPIGGDHVTQAIQEMFQVTRPEAERIKQEVADCLPDMAAAGGYGYQQPFETGGYETPQAQSYDPASYTQPVEQAPTSAADATALGGFSFDVGEPASAAPAADPLAFDLDFGAAAPEPGAPAAPAPSAFTIDFGAETPASASAPSAFTFDLEEGGEAVSAPAPNAFSFDLGGGDADLTTSPPGMLDLTLEAPPTASVAAAPAASSVDPFSFDLGTEAVPAPAAPAESALPSMSFELPAEPASVAGGFDLGGGIGDFTPAAPPATTGGGGELPALDLNLTDTPAPAAGGYLPAVEGVPAEQLASAELAPREDDLGVAPLDVYNVIAPVLGELSGETRRSLEYFTGKFPEIPITRMVLFGGGARLKNLDVFIQNEMGIRTTTANPFTHFTIAAKDVSESYLHSLGPTMTVALGLALRDMLGK